MKLNLNKLILESLSSNNDSWNYNKKVRQLSQDIEIYKNHTNREIENNKKCHPSKVSNSSQKYLDICKQRYKDFTGEEYKS